MNLTTVIDRSRKDKESWRYTNVEKILSASHTVPSGMPLVQTHRSSPVASQSPRLMFINGVLAPDQSRLDDLPQGFIAGDAKQGYSITLAGQTCLVTQPVELLFVTAPDAGAEITTRLHITLGASGRLSLLERHEGSASVHILETKVDLAAQAKLVHGKIIHDSAYITLTKASIAEGAYYDNFTLIKGGRLTRNEIEARLTGPLAQCALNGLMLLADSDHADTVTRIIHAAKDGISRQLYKTVAGGKAQGIFQGKILVDKGADKADGQQLSRALLLSDQAEIDAKPELEINADDVKCSHGCAVGNLDADALFYLRARGLNEFEARALLIRAFAEETLDAIHIPEWRGMFAAELEDWCDEQG